MRSIRQASGVAHLEWMQTYNTDDMERVDRTSTLFQAFPNWALLSLSPFARAHFIVNHPPRHFRIPDNEPTFEE